MPVIDIHTKGRVESTGQVVSRNPANGEIVETIREASPEGIDAAIFAAHRVQREWAARPVRERARVLRRLQRLLLDKTDELIALIGEENGKPAVEALSMEILPAVELLGFYADGAEKWLKPETIPLGKWNLMGRTSSIEYGPLGVVAIVSPWNFPFSIPFGQTAIALIVGNAVVLKPSEVAPRIGLKIGELYREAGLPEGLLAVCPGGPSAGAALVSHPDIQKIIFTGSVATGKKIMAAAAANLTPVVLELGGKDAMIVLPDADLDSATLERLAATLQIDDHFSALVNHGILGHGQGRLPAIGFDQQIGKHSHAECSVGIWNLIANRHGACVGIDHSADVDQSPAAACDRYDAIGVSSQPIACSRSLLYSRQIVFRDISFDP